MRCDNLFLYKFIYSQSDERSFNTLHDKEFSYRIWEHIWKSISAIIVKKISYWRDRVLSFHIWQHWTEQNWKCRYFKPNRTLRIQQEESQKNFYGLQKCSKKFEICNVFSLLSNFTQLCCGFFWFTLFSLLITSTTTEGESINRARIWWI